MKTSSRQLFLGAAIALCCAFTFVAVAEDAPPVVSPTASATLAPEPAAPAAEAKPDTPVAPAAAVETPAAPTEVQPPKAAESETAVESAKSPSPDEKAPLAPKSGKKPRAPTMHGLVINPGRRGGDQVRIFGDNVVREKSVVNGKVITVMGDTTIQGVVERDVISVMGDVTINGIVHGKVAALMGDITLGPEAHIDGDLMTKMGDVNRDEGAFVGGRTIQLADNEDFNVGLPPFQSWWDHGLSLGRPMAFGPDMGWLWKLSAFSIVLYVVFALVFPGGVQRCGDMLVRRPVLAVFSPMVALLALPLLFVLLCVTIVGIPVALIVLPLALTVAVLFGRAAIYGLAGRAISRNRLHPALAVLAGAVICLGLYLVPFLGLLLSLGVAWVGFGCVIAVMFTSEKKPALAAPQVAAFAPSARVTADATAALAGVTTNPVESPVLVAPAFQTQPVVAPLSTAGLPRAGFWLRAGALFIDGIIIAICFGPWAGPAVLPVLALYGALLWKFRGATVGGIVCGLQVVRIDDRPLDWPTAVVRALACFLSLVVAGLGFVWVAFDSEKQSWHDKIAGTTVVRPQKSRSLV